MRSLLDELAAGLRVTAEAAETEADRPSSLEEFLAQEITTDHGSWSLEGHEPFAGILRKLDRIVRKPEPGSSLAIIKCEQGGITTFGTGFGLQLASDLGYNVGYFLPTDTFVHKYGRTRLKRMIARSPYLSSRMKDREAVNQAAIKEFDGKFFYVLGLESMLGAISIPLDALLYDEVDMLPKENLEWSQGRVAHSKLRLSVYFSAGYMPGAGIDERYQEGTQHRYLVRCVRCGKADQCLEELWPESFAKVAGRWVRACAGCHRELDLVANGRWVATYPAREKDRKLSYRISSMILPARDADHIAQRWEKAQKRKSEMAKFDCAERAMPNAGAMQPVSDAELRQMRDPAVGLRLGRGELPRYAGLDMGDLCHFVCFERLPSGKSRLVWLEEIDSDRVVQRVSQLIGLLGVAQLVIDKHPLTSVARALAYAFPRIAAVQDFVPSSGTEVVDEKHEGKPYRCVKINRDESLDAFTSEITGADRGLLIPDKDQCGRAQFAVLQTFEKHLKNLRKERTIDAKGRTIDKYLRGVENHFGLGGNNARVAELIAPQYVPFRFDEIDYDELPRPWGVLLG